MKLKDWLRTNQASFRICDLSFIIKCLFTRGLPLVLEEDSYLSKDNLKHLEKVKTLYSQGVPTAYILGKEAFFGREFMVDERVLIPRKETELITERAIEIINSHRLKSVLDLCSGCGNIAITIKKQSLGPVTVFASDLNMEALKVAKTNAEKHSSSLCLVNSDLLSAFGKEKFDLIISNPPYVETDNVKGTLNFEPKQALEAGRDGMLFIERILRSACKCLKSKSYLVMEIGYQHKRPVSKLIQKLKTYKVIEWIKDYSGHWRGVVLQKNM